MPAFRSEAPLADDHLRAARNADRAPLTGVPRWARIAAHAVPIVILPSGLWRVGVMLAVPGFGTAQARDHGVELDVYLLGLFALSETLGLLTLGLVKPWGEVVPRWVPLLGGRRIPPLVAVVPATLGALAAIGVVYYFFLSILFTG